MEQIENRNEIEVDIWELVRALWRRKFLIIISGVLLMFITIVVTKFFVNPVYESTTSVYVLNQESNNTISYNDLQSGNQLTKDYKELIMSRPVLAQVIADLDLDMDSDELAGLITVNIPLDTRILEIVVKNEDPYLAKDIANSLRAAAAAHIKDVMNVVSVSTVEDGNLPEEPSGPSLKKNGIIALAAGLLFAIFGVLIIYFLDDTIKTPEDVEKYLGVGVLGSLPATDSIRKKGKFNKTKNRKAVR